MITIKRDGYVQSAKPSPAVLLCERLIHALFFCLFSARLRGKGYRRMDGDIKLAKPSKLLVLILEEFL
jgi:hypothetical protein